jgi:hypothetical protein
MPTVEAQAARVLCESRACFPVFPERLGRLIVSVHLGELALSDLPNPVGPLYFEIRQEAFGHFLFVW